MTLQERLAENDQYVIYHTYNGDTLSLPLAIVESWTPAQQRWINAKLESPSISDYIVERSLQVYKQAQADIKWQDRFARWMSEKSDRYYGFKRNSSDWRRYAPLWFKAFKFIVHRTGFYNRFVKAPF